MLGVRLRQLTRLRPSGFRLQCLAVLLYTSALMYWARLAAFSWHSGGVSVATAWNTLVTAYMLLLLVVSWRGIHLTLAKRFERKWTKPKLWAAFLLYSLTKTRSRRVVAIAIVILLAGGWYALVHTWAPRAFLDVVATLEAFLVINAVMLLWTSPLKRVRRFTAH